MGTHFNIGLAAISVFGLLIVAPVSVSAASTTWIDDVLHAASDTTQAAAVIVASTSPHLADIDMAGDLNNQDLLGLTRPAIVRIVTHISGTSTVPAPLIDFKTLEVSAAPSGKPIEIPYDNYLTGSGFIISPDGYILTAAHVVTDGAVKVQLAADSSYSFRLLKLFSLTAAESATLKAREDNKGAGTTLALNLLNYFRKNMTPLSVTSIIVLPATSTQVLGGSAFNTQMQQNSSATTEDSVKKIFAAGIPLKIVAQNDAFVDDEKDVAVGKVELTNLPAMRLGDSDAVKIAQNIFVFGYPSTADYAGITGEPSFTSGSINATKDSTLHTFSYLQTDAKISSGSSGGALFDSDGAAVGIIVKASESGSAGDGFAFAVPINIAKTFLAAHHITISDDTQDYAGHFLSGLSLQQQQHCKDAIAEFDAAGDANNTFGKASKYMDAHIDDCNALIASGKSIDSIFDQMRIWVGGAGTTVWMSIAAALVLLGAGGFFVWRLLKLLKKEEHIITDLQQQATQRQRVAEPQVQMQAAIPAQPAVDPQVLGYVMSSRKAGVPDEQIRSALVKSGWDMRQVSAAFVRG